MTSSEIGKQLVELCRKGEFRKAVEIFYASGIVSVEPMGMNGMSPETVGIQGVLGKGDWWVSNHEVHSMKVEGPFVARNQFMVYFDFDVTFKGNGKRMPMREMGIYTVEDGKIVREEFFYYEG